MKANECRVELFLNKTKVKFVIPVYQRNYSWTKKQCEQLLKDIIEVGGDKKLGGHFIGSIVYLQANTTLFSSIAEFIIIDGQQRITTLTLLYLALYKLAKKSGEEYFADELYETCLINKFAPDEEKLKLKSSMNNDKALKAIFSDDEENYTGFSQIIENFQFFHKELAKHDIEIIKLGLRKLMFVEISLEKDDDPQRIFESLNSTGLELSQADLIRNYILMGLNSKEQERLYSHYWEFIEQHARIETNNETRVSDFIRDFLTLENKEIPNKSKIYQEFKYKLDPDYTGQSINIDNLLGEMKSLVRFYNRIINYEKESDPEIRQQLKYIEKLEVNVANPFLMKVYEDYHEGIISKKTFIDILELVQSYVWRRFIVGLPTNTLNKVFATLYSKINKDDYYSSLSRYIIERPGVQRLPDNQELKSHFEVKDFYNIKKKSSFYLFERLENFQNKEYVTFDNSSITIEHIFPQNPDSEWQKMPLEEFNSLKESIHRIGNLTISGYNSNLQNKSFIHKRDLPEKGYKASRLWLNKHLSNFDKFDMNAMNSRTEALFERFLQVWSFPSGHDEYVRSYSYIPTIVNQKIKSYIFFGEEYKAADLSKTYQNTFKITYEKRPELLNERKLIELIKLTTDASSLSLPIFIGGNLFIENDINDTVKISAIQDALKLLGHSDKFIIKNA